WRARADILSDGWFHTGDVAEVTAESCVFLRGRKKDVISVSGMKFFPQEVEAVLTSHPGVESACVFAGPDPRLGEVPYARVVAKKGSGIRSERELLDYCRQRLADFKIPQRIELVEALPRTASGKILHRDAAPRREASRDRQEVQTH